MVLSLRKLAVWRRSIEQRPSASNNNNILTIYRACCERHRPFSRGFGSFHVQFAVLFGQVVIRAASFSRLVTNADNENQARAILAKEFVELHSGQVREREPEPEPRRRQYSVSEKEMEETLSSPTS